MADLFFWSVCSDETGWIWSKIDHKVLYKPVESIPARVPTVIKAKKGDKANTKNAIFYFF